jgi:hypothetical protein
MLLVVPIFHQILLLVPVRLQRKELVQKKMVQKA